MVKLMLEQHRISYLPLESVSMQERVRAVEFVLARCGFEQPAVSIRSQARPRAQTIPPVPAPEPSVRASIESWPYALVEPSETGA